MLCQGFKFHAAYQAYKASSKTPLTKLSPIHSSIDIVDHLRRVFLIYCAISVHVKEHLMVKVSGALHYGMPHNHIVVLTRKTPDNIMLLRFLNPENEGVTLFTDTLATIQWRQNVNNIRVLRVICMLNKLRWPKLMRSLSQQCASILSWLLAHQTSAVIHY